MTYDDGDFQRGLRGTGVLVRSREARSVQDSESPRRTLLDNRYDYQLGESPRRSRRYAPCARESFALAQRSTGCDSLRSSLRQRS